MTTTWLVRQGTGGLNASEMIEAGYSGVDFLGDYDIEPGYAKQLDPDGDRIACEARPM